MRGLGGPASVTFAIRPRTAGNFFGERVAFGLGCGPETGEGQPLEPERDEVLNKPGDGPTRPTDIRPRLLDYEAAALYLCTTPRHVRELWAQRRIAAIKVGRSVRFSVDDLDSFIASHRVDRVR